MLNFLSPPLCDSCVYVHLLSALAALPSAQTMAARIFAVQPPGVMQLRPPPMPRATG